MVAAIGDHEVVIEAALVIGEKAITLSALFQARHVDGSDAFERQGRIFHVAAFRPDQDLSHMGNIEQAGCRTGMEVFLQHAERILDRHVVAGKGHHLGAEFYMQVMKRSFGKGFVSFHWQSHTRVLGSRRARGKGIGRHSSGFVPPLSVCLRLLSLRPACLARLSPESVLPVGPFA